MLLAHTAKSTMRYTSSTLVVLLISQAVPHAPYQMQKRLTRPWSEYWRQACLRHSRP